MLLLAFRNISQHVCNHIEIGRRYPRDGNTKGDVKPRSEVRVPDREDGLRTTPPTFPTQGCDLSTTTLYYIPVVPHTGTAFGIGLLPGKSYGQVNVSA